MKKTFYFSHDYNARNDQKMIMLRSKYGAEGYGIFWMLIESMAESSNPHLPHKLIPMLAFSLNIEQNKLSDVINYCIDECGLFTSDGETFTSLRLYEHIKMRKNLSDSGIKGNQIKWAKESPPDRPPIAPRIQSKVKESKIKEIIKHPFLMNTVFLKTFNDYLEMRSKIKKPATENAKQLILKDLEKYDISTAQKILEQSIKNSWQGIFPLKNQINLPHTQNSIKQPEYKHPEPVSAADQERVRQMIAQTTKEMGIKK